MAKFKCLGTPDLVVSTSSGFIQFKNFSYTTTKKIEIEALKKCVNVVEVGAKPAPAKIKEVAKALFETKEK